MMFYSAITPAATSRYQLSIYSAAFEHEMQSENSFPVVGWVSTAAGEYCCYFIL